VSCGGGVVASHAFSYTSSGGITDLDTGTCSSSSSANGINDSGQIVGGFVNPANGPATHAFLDSGGVITDLGTFGGFDSTANAINDSGKIVGSYITSQGGSHAYMYSGGVFTDLGLDPFTFATDVNSAGEVVGYTVNSGFSYFDGDYNDCTLGIEAFAINDKGEVAGGTLANDAETAYLYSGGVMTDIASLGIYSRAYAINNLGQVVGIYGEPYGVPTHAFLYSGGVETDLDSLLPANSGWQITRAVGINDAGQIVGSGYYNGVPEAFLLDTDPPTPAPEPSSLGLLAAGAALLVLKLWRGPSPVRAGARQVRNLPHSFSTRAAGPDSFRHR
jgi:probable HAF family extracellular repeat protein